MTPVDFPEANAHFGPPVGVAESQVATIRAFLGPLMNGSMDGAQMVIVAWEPAPHELSMLNDGHPIFLTMLGGLAPHMLTTDFQSASNPR